MPVYELLIKLEVENVEKFTLDPEEFVWVVKTKCGQCGTVNPKFIYVDPRKEEALFGSRGTTNCNFKCTMCGRGRHIDVVKDSYCDYECEENDFSKIIELDFSGCEPEEWKMQNEGYTAENSHGVTFDVEFEDGEFADYDDENDEAVNIFKLEYKFQLAGKKKKGKRKGRRK